MLKLGYLVGCFKAKKYMFSDNWWTFVKLYPQENDNRNLMMTCETL